MNWESKVIFTPQRILIQRQITKTANKIQKFKNVIKYLEKNYKNSQQKFEQSQI